MPHQVVFTFHALHAREGEGGGGGEGACKAVEATHYADRKISTLSTCVKDISANGFVCS